MADYISLPSFSVDMRDATMPGSHVTAPTGALMARYLGATVQPTKNGDQYKLHFELDGYPGAVRGRLLDLNILGQAASGVPVDPAALKRAKGDLLALLVSGGVPMAQAANVMSNLDLNQYLPRMRFHVWHIEGDRSAANPNGSYSDIQFLAPDVWAERQRSLAAQTQATQANGVVQTAGPGAASAPPAINAGQLAAVMQTGAPTQGAPGATAPGALPGFGGGAALSVGGGSSGGLQIGGAPVGGLPAFGAPPSGGGVGSFLAPGAGR